MRQSVLPRVWWETPETSEVPISEKWTAADAAAGAEPPASSSVERGDAVPHAEGPVDELRHQAREREDQPSLRTTHLRNAHYLYSIKSTIRHDMSTVHLIDPTPHVAETPITACCLRAGAHF